MKTNKFTQRILKNHPHIVPAMLNIPDTFRTTLKLIRSERLPTKVGFELVGTNEESESVINYVKRGIMLPGRNEKELGQDWMVELSWLTSFSALRNQAASYIRLSDDVADYVHSLGTMTYKAKDCCPQGDLIVSFRLAGEDVCIIAHHCGGGISIQSCGKDLASDKSSYSLWDDESEHKSVVDDAKAADGYENLFDGIGFLAKLQQVIKDGIPVDITTEDVSYVVGEGKKARKVTKTCKYIALGKIGKERAQETAKAIAAHKGDAQYRKSNWFRRPHYRHQHDKSVHVKGAWCKRHAEITTENTETVYTL